ncbi:MAG: hypothetical protein ACFE8N_01340 [Promethearchaeota archaeon]
MEKICDLHIHSKYSGGSSKNIDISKMAIASDKKSVDIVGTGDCTHLSWLKELKINLVEYSNGIYYTPKATLVYFILQTEIEVIWKHNSHLKRIYFIVLFPNYERLDESLEYISRFGDIRKGGRIKLYKPAEILVYGLKSIDSRIGVIPVHIFTPYYGIFGNYSGFNNLKKALGDSMSLKYAVESGLSAYPFMVRSISVLNKNIIISNSDSHSTSYHRLGREANLIYLNKLDFQNLIDSIRKDRIIKTYEFKSSVGKYYYDRHRKE